MDKRKELQKKRAEMKCRDCKSYCIQFPSHYAICTRLLALLSQNIKAGECPWYEWQDKLTKEDFVDYG